MRSCWTHIASTRDDGRFASAGLVHLIFARPCAFAGVAKAMAWIMSVSQSHAFTPPVWRNRISAGLAKSGKSSRSSSILMIRPLTLDAHDCTSMRLGQEDQNLAASGRRARSGAHVTFGGFLWAHRASSPHPAKALLNRLIVHGLRPVPPWAIGEQSTAPVRSAARCLIAPKLECPPPGIVTQAWISSVKP